MRERTGGAARLPLVAALVVVACTVPATAAQAATTADEADTVVALVNEEREEAGCDPVTVDDSLAEAAEDHSEDQADMGKMTHTGSDGSSVGERATRAGYDWSRIGENVASGTRSPEGAMELWMNSSAHRENILNCAFEHIGVGRSGSYWTQDFGKQS